MSGEAPALMRTFKVGSREVTLSARRSNGHIGGVLIEWHPNVPKKLSDGELAQYRLGRDLALSELAQQLGGTVAVVEI